MKTKNKTILILSLTLLLGCVAESSNDSISPCLDTNCANYTSQAAAQAAFDSDPTCRNDLDRDNDGIACEEAGNSVKTCATTSSCGCSNKNKSPCELDPCCKWTVGSGCDCR